MDRYDLVVITLAGWYFHPGQKKEMGQFMEELYTLANLVTDHLDEQEMLEKWQSSRQESQEQQSSEPDSSEAAANEQQTEPTSNCNGNNSSGKNGCPIQPSKDESQTLKQQDSIQSLRPEEVRALRQWHQHE